ncbi:MAG: DUF86 domain-containing protein [Myxococcota bacterium]|nr:DUF86 domain-containing protein [Myxococcota bacterium]
MRQYLADLVRYRDTLDQERFRRERDLQYQVLFPLTMAIQCCVDAGNHVVAEEGLPRPGAAAEVFARLADAGRLPRPLADRLSRAVGARNLFVHRYWQINHDRVRQMLQHDIDAFAQFEGWLVRLLEPGEDAGPPRTEA